LAKQAEEKAVKAGSIRQLARAFKNSGISYDIKGKTDSALLFFEKALALAKQHQLHPTLANIITDVANAYYAAGNYELALRHHFDALRLREGYKTKKPKHITILPWFIALGKIIQCRKSISSFVGFKNGDW
jgi:tetratricopeptide (TPR) repeat protein